MRFVFLGPPGAGKGTQAQRLCSDRSIPQISTGDLFRAALGAGTKLGLEAKGFMDRGELVPDSVVCGMVGERLGAPDAQSGFILDGFPRTTAQAESLEAELARSDRPLTACVEFVVSKDDLVRRLTRRLTCKSCSAVFNLDAAPPKRAGVCDRCGGELYVRNDDRPETVEKRLKEYDAKTAAVSGFYASRGLLRRLDASRSPDEIYAELQGLIGRP
jgi:adenylate kinase